MMIDAIIKRILESNINERDMETLHSDSGYTIEKDGNTIFVVYKGKPVGKGVFNTVDKEYQIEFNDYSYEGFKDLKSITKHTKKHGLK